MNQQANLPPARRRPFWPHGFLLRAALAGAALALLCAPVTIRAQAATGSIAGSVSNAATRDLLVGARVDIPQLGLSALTDDTGQYVFKDVPVGTHEVVASYIGLDAGRGTVTVAAGQWARCSFDLTAQAVYKLDAFEVKAEREGMAAAVTAQRNAENVKNVASMDLYGDLPNLNATELAMRLPGVSGIFGDEVTEGLNIRGIGAGLNTITMDGSLLSSFGANSGQTRMQTFTGSMFDSLELVKGHTPDKEAGSLGGTVNLKSRSPLSMREKRRVTYNLTLNAAPPFTMQIPLREDHRYHPLFDANYTEKFSVFGGQDNLGVSMNFFYSENVFGNYQTLRDHQNTAMENPAYVWDYRLRDNFNNRKQESVNAKVEFRLSPTTKFLMNTLYNDHYEPFKRTFNTRFFNNQTVGTTGTAGVLPGYTDTFQQVRANSGSNVDLGISRLDRILRQRQIALGAEHSYGPFDIDYRADYGKTQYRFGGNEAALTMRVSNVGWTLDRGVSDVFPRITQTEGADISNPNNYSPVSNGLTTSSGESYDSHLTELKANLRYRVPVTIALSAKVGAVYREQVTEDDFTKRRRWSYIGATKLPNDPSIVMFSDKYDTGPHLPRWDVSSVYQHGRLVNPELWKEDLYYTAQQLVGGHEKTSTQTITGGYGMISGKIGHTGFLTGVRTEKTEMKATAYVQTAAPYRSTAAEQLANPMAAALKDWNNPREVRGEYTKSFPSVHLYHDILRNLKARVSYSTSFGRPPPQDSYPSESVDTANEKITVSNPGLRPEMASTWDTSLEYYFSQVGSVSVGWFKKTIKDYFGPSTEQGTVGDGPDNGFGGSYSGYHLFKRTNLGTAEIRGWEFSFQQQMTFLPGLLKGLGLNANYTILETEGDFGGTATRSTNAVAGFVPHTGNVSLSWKYNKFSMIVLYNYTGLFLQGWGGAGNPQRDNWTDKRETVNLGFNYRIRPSQTIGLNFENAFNEPSINYRGVPSRMSGDTITMTRVSVSLKGQF